MNPEDAQINELAEEQGVGVAALRELLAALHEQIGAAHFYVFWTSVKAAGASGARRQRTLLAFLTPDTALGFTQRNQLTATDRPRLRRLSLLQLLQAILREPAITAILFVADHDDQPPPAGQLPHGTLIERAELLRRLAGEDGA